MSIRSSNIAAALLAVATLLPVNGRATVCRQEHLSWARTGAHGQILAGGSYETFLSTDSGQSWEPVAWPVENFIAPIMVGEDLFVATLDSTAMLHSRDFGRNWSPVGPARRAMANDGHGNIYACSIGNAFVERLDSATGRWYRTGKFGQRTVKQGEFPWKFAGPDSCEQIAAHGPNITVTSGRGMFYSADQGKHWRGIALPDDIVYRPVGYFDVHAADDGAIYANYWYEHDGLALPRVVRSMDHGASWPTLDLGQVDGKYRLVAAVGRGGAYIIAGDTRDETGVLPLALYRVNDGKASKLLAIEARDEHPALAFGADGSIVLAWRNEIMVSDTSGANWKKIPGNAMTKEIWDECASLGQ